MHIANKEGIDTKESNNFCLQTISGITIIITIILPVE